ncbi:alpha-1,2 mannosyltransferase Ktr1p [Diutina catenulata]
MRLHWWVWGAVAAHVFEWHPRGPDEGLDRAPFKRWLGALPDTTTVEVVRPGGSAANATYVVLCRNSDQYDMLETIQNVQDRVAHAYDWTFLNDEPFTKDFIFLVSARFTTGTTTFATISEGWGYPNHIDLDMAYQRYDALADLPYGQSESYRHMCRWYSGFFWRHWAVARYQYYWRLEPGVRLAYDIDYDVFGYMETRGLRYGYALTIFEYSQTIPSLWHHFKQFLATAGIAPESLPLLDLVQNDDAYQSYNLCHFWNNFEIAAVDVFANERYQQFFEYLDSVGGFYYERWGDAPIHTLAVVLGLQRDELHWFSDVGYYHSPYWQCPQNDDVFLDGRCSCDPDEDFSFGMYSCTPHFLKVTGQEEGR